MRFAVGLFLVFSTLGAAQTPNPLRLINTTFATLNERLRPAIVTIRSDSFAPVGGDSGVRARQTDMGSGVIVSPEGYIVTNAHVVGRRLTVSVTQLVRPPEPGHNVLAPHVRQLEGRVLGVDKETDLALVKIDAKEPLPFIEYGDSESVKQGELVLALGNPLGLENSVTMGIISAVARQLKPDDRVVYLQTDAPINPGNSGGALVDIDGKLIGINTMILSQSGGSEGLGFAVPQNIVKSIAEQLKDHGRVIRGDIGVTAQTITPNLARSLKLARDSGVVLADVEQGGGADNAGLKIGDVILSVNGRRMESARQFHVWVYRQPVNAVAKVEYMRGQETATADVVVLEQPDKSMHFIRLDNPADHVFARLRILGIEVDDDVLKEMPPLRLNYGIVVLGLLPGISSGDPQLEVGDVIHQVEGQPVATLKDLRDNLGQHKASETLVLQIEREGKLRFIEFTLD